MTQNHNTQKANRGIELLLRAVRFYTFNTPIAKGKYRIYQTALKVFRVRPPAMLSSVKDGRQFIIDLNTGMQESVFFLGEYESAITEIAAKLIHTGDVCLDVGANFGWYTTLMARHTGVAGEVHSFEPVPKSFEELTANRGLIPGNETVCLNNVALGDREGSVTINLFDGQPSGHASLAVKDETGVTSFECRMMTLDAYLIEHNVANVHFVKVDIEGAEMMFFKGAERLFTQNQPPIFLVEMAVEQTRNFGYMPNDLIDSISERGEYDFYTVDEALFKLRKLDRFADGDIGANVFCIPQNAAENIQAVVNEYLID